ncbi:hypothetical protein RXV95_07520 [Novosphingobium sp. ZN18A2]|uniref:hypothetical protein n=1 Tax=Novosphingobium sp. ZN18A2 TaxID=3079861 RepID=UPI0030CB36D5
MDEQLKSLQNAVPLDPLQRFALAYCPARARDHWRGLFALETRLADAARAGREPIAVQMRLAWWRDRFASPARTWPAGEPLLALLEAWERERAALGLLVDGWEAASVGEDGGAELRAARVEAMVALARLLDCEDEDAVRAAAKGWTEPGRGEALPVLPRVMRPLAVLRGLAVREARAGKRRPFGDLFAGMRIGLTGR